MVCVRLESANNSRNVKFELCKNIPSSRGDIFERGKPAQGAGFLRGRASVRIGIVGGGVRIIGVAPTVSVKDIMGVILVTVPEKM